MKRNHVWVLERSLHGGDYKPFFSFLQERDANFSLEHSRQTRPGNFRVTKYTPDQSGGD